MMEQKLTNAEKIGDINALEELLSDDFTGINFHGKSIDKNSFISDHSNPDLKFNKLDISELKLKLIDAVGIVTGKTSYEATYKGNPIAGSTRFMDVWLINNDERTLLISSAVIREES